LLVTAFLTLFLKVFSLQGKDASKPAGISFQLLMVLFRKEYLPTSVLCFLEKEKRNNNSNNNNNFKEIVVVVKLEN